MGRHNRTSDQSFFRGSALRTLAYALLAVYVAAANILFLGLEGEEVRQLMLSLWMFSKTLMLPVWFTPEHFSVVANVLAFVPLTLALTVLFRLLPWWGWGIAASVLSGGIELTQLLLLDTRIPSTVDVLANSIGAFLGALAGCRLCSATKRNVVPLTGESFDDPVSDERVKCDEP